MGGWRCSFRNCTMRSDGKTHMFHFPVFDKVRCHQWLVNSGRLDFLNLKVSQVKNRVICEHHFLDEQFMNFKKDKLTFDAVPCIDGPYCETSEAENKTVEETNDSLSIMIDDIENEYMTLLDKRANYSVKYADFLTSNDLDGIDISTLVSQSRNKLSEIVLPPHKNRDSKFYMVPEIVERKPKTYMTPEMVETKPEPYMVPEIVERKDKPSCEVFVHSIKSNSAADNNVNYSNTPTTDMYKKYEAQPVLIIPPYQTKPTQSQNEENYLEVELPPGFINNNTLLKDDKGTILESTRCNIDDKANLMVSERNNVDSNVDAKALTPVKKPKVKILSEKKISEPFTVFPLKGNLELVSPSTVLPMLQKKPPTIKPQEVSNEIITSNNELLLDSKPPKEIISQAIDSKPPKEITNETNNTVLEKKVIKEHKGKQENKIKSPRVSLLKNKITPERIAAIEEKRKYNMKLRDIIESFLDKLDEQDKEIKETKNNSVCDKDKTKNVTHKLKAQNEQERMIANLEDKIKKMENNLINKIDKNSQRILELKNTIVQQPKQKQKKSHSTQTSFDNESEKKRLYEEISQYLSPNANSLVYEELFINKFGKDTPKAPSAKRKRAR